jgi:DNA-directed RNA polymerase specialized sigma subunit
VDEDRIAKVLLISKSEVSEIFNNAIKKIRKKLGLNVRD